MPTFHHANVCVYEDGVEAQTRWLVDILGYRQISVSNDWPKSGPFWFEADDGSQVHLSRDPVHRPSAPGHVALVYEDLEPVRQRLEENDLKYDFSDRGELQVINTWDPAGNLWELRRNIS